MSEDVKFKDKRGMILDIKRELETSNLESMMRMTYDEIFELHVSVMILAAKAKKYKHIINGAYGATGGN